MVNLILIIILAVITIAFIKMFLNIGYIARLFKHGNVIVWGKKRKGKDLLFQIVINKRKKPYLTNYPAKYNYGGNGLEIGINSLSVAPNTYESTITNKITKIDYKKLYEKRDVYIADAGIYLPSHQYHIIGKNFPSLPIYYSVIGHLYDSNIHTNYNGSITRLYDKLREQADEYIKVLGSVKFLGFIFIKVRYYEIYETAAKGLLPMKKALINSHQRAIYDEYTATNGLIKDMWVYIRKRKIHYDTRYFRRVFFKDTK